MARQEFLNPDKLRITLVYRERHTFAFCDLFEESDKKDQLAYLIVESEGAGHFFDDWYAIPKKLKEKAYELFENKHSTVDELYEFIEEHKLKQVYSMDQACSGTFRYQDRYQAWLTLGGPFLNAKMEAIFFPPEFEDLID